MEKRGSAELLNVDQNHFKNASSDSLNSDSKSSSLNSKMGQESVRNNFLISLLLKYKFLELFGKIIIFVQLNILLVYKPQESWEKASHSKSFSTSSTSTDNNIISALETKKENQGKDDSVK